MFIRIINLDSRPDRWKRLEHLNFQRYSAKTTSKNISLRTFCDMMHSRKTHQSIHGHGALGCYESHVGVWKEFLKSTEELCVIFEDDIDTKYIDLQIPKDCEIHLLGWCGTLKTIGNQVMPYPKEGWVGAHAYCISRRVAQLLVDNAYPIEMQVDYYIQAIAYKYGLSITHSKNKIKQVWTGGSDVFSICLQCEWYYLFLIGIFTTILIYFIYKLIKHI